VNMGKSSAPPAPDYQGAARQQGTENMQTAIANNIMARPNEVTPYGSRTWSKIGQELVGDQHVPIWQSRETFSPLGQQRFDQEQRIIGSLGNTAEAGLGRVGQSMGQPFDMSQVGGRPDLPTPLGQGQQGNQAWIQRGDSYQRNPNYMPQGQMGSSVSYPQGGGGPMARESAGMVPPEFRQGGQQQYGGQVPGLPQQSQLPGVPNIPNQGNVGDSLYSQATRYMDPQFKQQREMLENKLVNQGLQRGTEAFDTAMRNQGMDQERAYADARDRAIMASGAEQSRQFGLNSDQFGLGLARGAQEFGQGSDLFRMGLAGQGQQFGQEAQLFGLGQGARQQDISEQAYLRNLPLNELNALRSGSQVSLPNFQNFSSAGTQAAPVAGATQMAGDYSTDVWNAQNQQRSGLINAGAGLGSAWIMASILA
jgi:hypothetical protein